MVQLSRNAGIKPLLATLPPDTRNSNDDTERLYNPAIRNLAAEMGVPLSDQYKALAPRWNRWSDDDLHPNWIGYLVMAIEWYLTLE